MPSHTMYALNMERVLAQLWHPSHEELEQDHIHRQRLAGVTSSSGKDSDSVTHSFPGAHLSHLPIFGSLQLTSGNLAVQ
ncbi:hypothetical protein XENOCAPTIV_018767 [Xenoophorus captivus]|uniref:Uncharacterized protein n=1 Tax=Xenoophorus captivus TaxID=1517983 RepID=A0ABV0SAZ8_9TELE